MCTLRAPVNFSTKLAGLWNFRFNQIAILNDSLNFIIVKSSLIFALWGALQYWTLEPRVSYMLGKWFTISLGLRFVYVVLKFANICCYKITSYVLEVLISNTIIKIPVQM